MTNKGRQAKLDRERWLESKNQGYDMSGCMLYCEKCEYADHTPPTMNGKCYKTQEDRESGCLCAKAYDKATRKENK